MKVAAFFQLAWLAALTNADTEAGTFTYSYNQRDVKPLKLQRAPIMAEPMRKREEPAHYQSHNHLFPAIHPGLNKRDIQHLHSRAAHTLFYTKNGGICKCPRQLDASLCILTG